MKFYKFLLLLCTLACVECKIEYSERQLEEMTKLRELIPDIREKDEFYRTDNYLIRWLGASNMNANVANNKIRETFQWRDANAIDSIVEENVYSFTNTLYVYHGFDKERRPIVLFAPASVDLRRLILAGKRNVAVRAFDQMLEKGFYELKKVPNTTLMSNGERVMQVTAILDMSGFNRRQHFCLQCIGVYVEWFLHLENYYPGALSFLILTNVNRIALPLIELIKPYLTEATRKGVQIFGPNRLEWSKFLLSIIDADQLPYRFGGTSKFTI